MQTRATYSEALAQIIDEEVELIIKNAHQKATKLLKENKSKLDNMARLLVERETIYQDEVDMIMNGVDANEIMKIMEARDENYRDNPFYKMTEKMENEEGVAKSENVENSVENPTEIATENSDSVNE